jgi:hypothetical protein
MVQIFGCKSRIHRTLGSHKIRVFRHRSEQLVSQEARWEFKEALAHVLGAEASPEAALTVTRLRLSRLTIVGLTCQYPLIKVPLVAMIP